MNGADRVFIDTNVWLYAFVAGDSAKAAVAASLIQRSTIAVSIQVINEVCVNLIRKAGFKEPDVRALIDSYYAKCLVAPQDKATLVAASELRGQYSLSFWDSMIVASAMHCQAATLFSEDLQDGLVVHGLLRVVNPFKSH